MSHIIDIWKEFGDFEQSLIAVVLAIVIYVFVRYVIIRRMEKIANMTTNDLDDRLILFIKQFLWAIALFLTIILILKINQIEISPLLAGAGIFGVALGLAAKETLGDILSGIFLIADRPIRIGDRVKIENIGRHWGSWGDVEDIGLRRTRIRNTDGVIVNYPNSVLGNSIINNFSYVSQPVRVRIRFQVSYDADVDLTKELVINAINSVDGIVGDSAQIVTRSLWDDTRGLLLSGVLLEGRYRLENVRARTVIRSNVLEMVLKSFQEHNIPLAMHPVVIKGSADKVR